MRTAVDEDEQIQITLTAKEWSIAAAACLFVGKNPGMFEYHTVAAKIREGVARHDPSSNSPGES